MKRDHPVFQTTDFNWDVWGTGKRLHLNGSDMNVVVAGNFQVTDLSMSPGFQHTGMWYDYFTGDALDVTDLEAAMDFAPGEYHLWTDVALETPENILGIEEARQPAGFTVGPNPGRDALIRFGAPVTVASEVHILDLTGRRVANLPVEVGAEQLSLPSGLPDGPLLIRWVAPTGNQAAYWLNVD